MVLKSYAAVLLKLKFTSDVNAEDGNMEKECVICFLSFYLEPILTGSIRKENDFILEGWRGHYP